MKIDFLRFSSTVITPDMIDADYRGHVSAIFFFNFSNTCTEIKKGSRFAQIVFHKIANPPGLREVKNFEDNTQRGEESFGSTGIKYFCRQELH